MFTNKLLGQQQKSTTVAALSVSHGPTPFQFQAFLTQVFTEQSILTFTFPTEAMYTLCVQFC